MKDKEPISFKQQKDRRMAENLSRLTGRWRGTYYREGVANPGTALLTPIQMLQNRRINQRN